jgi:hypothetical protein
MAIGERVDNNRIWTEGGVLVGTGLALTGELTAAFAQFDEVWRIADKDNIVVPALMAAWYAGYWHKHVGNLDEAKRWLRRELSRPRQATESESRTLLTSFLVDVHNEAGELLEARRTLGRCSFAPRLAHVWAANAFFEGRWDEAKGMLSEFIEGAKQFGNSISVFLGREILARVLMTEADFGEAVAVMEEAAASLPSERRLISTFKMFSDLARALAYSGHLDRSHEEISALRAALVPGERWPAIDAALHHAEGVLASVDGSHVQAEEHLTAAVTKLHACGTQWVEADALLDQARARAVAGDTTGATDSLKAASAVYRHIGAAEQWHRRVERCADSIHGSGRVPKYK